MNLSYDNLVAVLTVANESERLAAQQQAEAQLAAWESQSGYHYLLQSVYLNADLALQVRWLAVICFKNGVDKYWRLSRANAIAKPEKQQIRARLFDMVAEKNNQLAIQNAHTVARIVRFDFPTEWPTVFDTLTERLEECVFVRDDLVLTNNLLLILNQVIKAVAVVRIGRLRHALQAKAPLITPVLAKLYLRFFHQWSAVQLDLGVMQICYLCLKNLRRIIPEGYEHPNKSAEVVEFLEVSVAHLQQLVVEHDRYAALDMLERYVRCYSKLYVNLLNANPTGFVLLPNLHTILQTYMTLLDQRARTVYEASADNGGFWEALALKGFLILKRVIAYVYKRGAVVLRDRNDREEIQQAIAKLTANIFTQPVIEHLCDLIVDWYLRLKPSDLESWLIEPEEWCNEETLASWEFQVRPCAENLFQDLITFFKPQLSGFVMQKISAGLSQADGGTDAILTKDAILCTFQLSALSIADSVDFDQILRDLLIPEGLKDDPLEARIIRRRVCLVVGEWVPVKCLKDSRVLIYKLLASFLQPHRLNDAVVRLTAVQTLKHMLDDYGFNKYDFQPFLNEFISLCVAFLLEVEFTESKMYIVNIILLMVQRCNPLVDYQTLMGVLSIVPRLWSPPAAAAADNDTILKNALLRVLKSLVVALNQNSPQTFEISLPLIKRCCDGANTETYAFLSEDGYELWLAILQYLPETTGDGHSEVTTLWPLVAYGLTNSTEILPVILAIMRSYALISPQLYGDGYSAQLFGTLATYLATMRDDSFVVFVSLMDILLLEGSEQLIELLATSGLLRAMLEYVLSDSRHISDTNKMYMLFGRFDSAKLLELVGQSLVDPRRFFGAWAANVNANANPRAKKIALMSLVAVCTRSILMEQQTLVEVMPLVLKNALLFLEEVHETEQGDCDAYAENLPYDDIDDYCYLDPDIAPHGEKLRYQKLVQTRDPVHRTNLRQFLTEAVRELHRELGAAAFSRLVANDVYTIEHLQQMVG